MTSRQYYYGHIFADPQDVNTVYTFCAKYFYKSTDGGTKYTEVQTPHGDYHDLWIDPNNHLRMVNGSDGGAAVTFNGGRTWSSIDNQPTGQFYTAITDNSVPYRVVRLAAGQHALSRSRAAPTAAASPPTTGTRSAAARAATSRRRLRIPPVIFGGSYFGLMTRYDEPRGETRNMTIWPDYNGGRTAADVKYRFQWTYPIIVSPHDGKAVYAGAQVLFRSTNERPELGGNQPRPDAQRQGEGTRRTTRGVLLDDLHDRPVAARARYDLDRIRRWSRARDAQRGPGLAECDAARASSRSLASTSSRHRRTTPGRRTSRPTRYQLDDFAPSIFKTTDYGQTWADDRRREFPRIPSCASSARIPAERICSMPAPKAGVYYSLDGGAAMAVAAAQSADRADHRSHAQERRPHRGDPGARVLDSRRCRGPARAGDDRAASSAHLFAPRDAIRSPRAGFGRGACRRRPESAGRRDHHLSTGRCAAR